MQSSTRRRLAQGAVAAMAITALTAGVAPSGAGAKPDDKVEVTKKSDAFDKKGEGAKKKDDFSLAVGFDYGYSKVPSRLSPGTYDFDFENRSAHEIVFFKLQPGEEDSTKEDVVAAADAGDEAFFEGFRGVSFAEPLSEQGTEEIQDGEETFTVGRADLSEPGRYVYICFIPNAEGVPHYKLDDGMLGFINVK